MLGWRDVPVDNSSLGKTAVAAEPHMEQRKEIAFRALVFLLVFAGLLYFTKRKIWANVEGHA